MKHLIYLIDGTWLSPISCSTERRFSNIFKLNGLFSDDKANDKNHQIVFYQRGIGAVAGVQGILPGAFAANLKEEIEDVYINISANYVKEDKIYLYGFSRGAVVARVVANLVASCGLLYSADIHRFDEIWEFYRRKVSGSNHNLVMSDQLRECCNDEVPIEFIGVFDTVLGGLIVDNEEQAKFVGTILPESVKSAVHIVAMDERRSFFQPLFWNALDNADRVEQIWMPGVHGDIGGCYPDSALGDLSLLTMIQRTRDKTSLSFELEKIDDGRLTVPHLEENVLASFKSQQFMINNEWENWKLARPITTLFRTTPQRRETHYLHPVAKNLDSDEARVYMRSKDKHRKYKLHPHFADLDLARDESPYRIGLQRLAPKHHGRM